MRGVNNFAMKNIEASSQSDCRKCNIDLLRCVSMFMVVVLHCCVHGLGYSELQTDLYNVEPNTPYLVWLVGISSIAVNLFFIISGYFHSTFKWRKMGSLYIQTAFWSGACYVFYKLFVEHDNATFIVSVLRLWKNIILGFSHYWFIVAYILIYIFSDYIVRGLNSLSDAELNKIVISLIVIEIAFGFCLKSVTYGGPRTILPCLSMYILGYWIYRFQNKIIPHRKLIYIMYVICLLIITNLALYFICNGKFQPAWEMTTDYYNPFIIFMSFAVFIFFMNLNIPNNSVLMNISKSTFAIYLISDNTWVRSIIYEPLKVILRHSTNGEIVILVVLLYSLCIFCGGLFFEMLRKIIMPRFLFENIFNRRFKSEG